MALMTVLTGDLIGSAKVHNTDAFIHALALGLKRLERTYGLDSEIFRGDGFQVRVQDPAQGFHCVVALRAGLIASSPPGERWDARVAIGIVRSEPTQNYGEAFVLSGRGLDNMKRETLELFSTDQSVTERLGLSTRFAAVIIDKWTAVEAHTYHMHLLDPSSQQALAKKLGKSRVTVNLALQRAQSRLLDAYLNYAKKVVEEADHA